ncbi:hypothetical protein OAM37_03595 [bacterium]|nr:hypothetical protein [bacterium]
MELAGDGASRRSRTTMGVRDDAMLARIVLEPYLSLKKQAASRRVASGVFSAADGKTMALAVKISSQPSKIDLRVPPKRSNAVGAYQSGSMCDIC